jgi:hypothetical protein
LPPFHQLAGVEEHLLEVPQYLAQVDRAAVAHLRPTHLQMVQAGKVTLVAQDLRVKIVVEVVARMLWAQVQLARAHQIRLAQVVQV